MCGIDRRPRRHPGPPLPALLLAALLLLLAGWGGARAAGGVPQASAIRVEAAGAGQRTRVVVELDRPVAFRTFAVPDPVRLVIDLPEVEWRLRAGRGTRRGLVTAERHGLFGPGRSRLVLDLAAPFRVVHQALVSPPAGRRGSHRLVVEVEPLQAAATAPGPARPAAAPRAPPARTTVAAAPLPPPPASAAPVPAAVAAAAVAVQPVRAGRPPPVPLPRPGQRDVAAALAPMLEAKEPGPTITAAAVVPAPAAAPERPAPPGPAAGLVEAALAAPRPPTAAPLADDPLPVIVIDPGHGGVDPGAVGVDGTLEKDVVLELARALRGLLEATGRYRVVLTREDDSFVRLRERIARAREARGDLFVSLHADSLSQAAQRGASVYTLSETATDEEAGRLASKENKSDVLASTDLSAHDAVVTSILIDLAQRETNNRSIGFAEVLADELAGAATLVRRRQRSAGFAVLKSPDIPSVLIEIGYLSNPEDARNLAQAGYRAGLAGAVLRALDRQFGHTRS